MGSVETVAGKGLYFGGRIKFVNQNQCLCIANKNHEVGLLKYFTFGLVLLKIKWDKDGIGKDFSAKWNHHVCWVYSTDNEGMVYRKVDSHNHVISFTVIWSCW